MWSAVGPVTLICKVSHDIMSVQDLILEFIPSQQCHSVRNTDPVLNCYMAVDVPCSFIVTCQQAQTYPNGILLHNDFCV